MVISKELMKYSLSNLEHRKARSFLTVLSIFIGIATIFIFISFGLGLYHFVDNFSSGTSVDKITIMPKGGSAPGLDDSFALTEDDLNAVKNTPGIFEASGMYTKAVEVKQDKLNKYTFLIGYDLETPIIFEVSNIDIAVGRELKPGDSGKVALGYNYYLKDKIFPRAYGINSKIEINGKDFRIVGFYGAVGNPQDDSQIYMSNDDFRELFADNPPSGYAMMMAKADASNMDTVISRVERNLRNSRDVDEGKEDFYVQSFEDLINTYASILQGIAGFVILIAMISVLVSAINTANTMITSVIERTKEIGVMKAVGAKNSEVFKIFLFESAVLGLIAGILGVAVGGSLSYAAGSLLSALGWSIFKPEFSISLFVNLIIFATLTGALSGAIPAYQASRISPVKALRYE